MRLDRLNAPAYFSLLGPGASRLGPSAAVASETIVSDEPHRRRNPSCLEEIEKCSLGSSPRATERQKTAKVGGDAGRSIAFDASVPLVDAPRHPLDAVACAPSSAPRASALPRLSWQDRLRAVEGVRATTAATSTSREDGKVLLND